MHWLILMVAIAAEIVSTSLLKSSVGFTRLWPSVGVVAGYACSFYLLSVALKTLPLSIAYAIWAAAGTVLIALVGVLLFAERLTVLQVAGIALTALGVILINLGAGPGHHAAAEGSTHASSSSALSR